MFRDRFCEVYFPDNWFSLLLSPSLIPSDTVRSLVPSVKVGFPPDVGTSQLMLVAGVTLLECVWNVMAFGDAREGKWTGNWRMEWVASTLHTTSEHGVSSITTADAHISAASSRLNWRPCRFKWTRPFRRKTKSGFCACAITFQPQSTEYT
jgi:hypothetical protein